MSELDNWLSLTKEEILEPEFPICDSHHHLRRHEENKYIGEDFLCDAVGGHNIVQTVFIQSYMNQQIGPGGGMSPVGEVEFVLSEIAENRTKINMAAAIVGSADLNSGSSVAPILESQLAAGNNRFRGIRFMPDRPMDRRGYLPGNSLLSPAVQEGLATLCKYDLSYDVIVDHHQLSDISELARKFPELPIIINHMGISPLRDKNEKERAEVIEEWKRGISSLTPYNKVYLKLGGIGMDTFGYGWQKKAAPPSSIEIAKGVADYVLFCIEQLGTKRCMFESNFPVDKVSFPYNIIWNAFKHITKNFSQTERLLLFHDTAAEVYRLPKWNIDKLSTI